MVQSGNAGFMGFCSVEERRLLGLDWKKPGFRPGSEPGGQRVGFVYVVSSHMEVYLVSLFALSSPDEDYLCLLLKLESSRTNGESEPAKNIFLCPPLRLSPVLFQMFWSLVQVTVTEGPSNLTSRTSISSLLNEPVVIEVLKR